jgi:hypothetical protein
MKISRRALAQVALAGSALAQTPPADDLEQARKQVEANSEILRKYEISITAEPAFQFKA